jgi:Flp pilus assembly protein TadG
MGPGRRAPGDAPDTAPDTGAAALEFAIVAPILFALLFGIVAAGWGLWELQASRTTAREAARLASVGIPAAAGYTTAVACLGERNGMPHGSLTAVAVHFADSPERLSTTAATVEPGDYVLVTLTFTSAVRGLPFTNWHTSDANGHFLATAVTRVEQVATGTGAVASDQTLAVTSGACP